MTSLRLRMVAVDAASFTRARTHIPQKGRKPRPIPSRRLVPLGSSRRWSGSKSEGVRQLRATVISTSLQIPFVSAKASKVRRMTSPRRHHRHRQQGGHCVGTQLSFLIAYKWRLGRIECWDPPRQQLLKTPMLVAPTSRPPPAGRAGRRLGVIRSRWTKALRREKGGSPPTPRGTLSIPSTRPPS